jgi:C_GCAxxG_C_C family probable redox protein
MNKKSEQASEYFQNGLYCSQAVFGVFSEKYGLDKDSAFKISCGLGSGVRSAEICGAVSGAVLVIGLKCGDTPGICNAEVEDFIKRFKGLNGNTVCRNILGCDVSTLDGREKAIKGNLFKTRCDDMVRSSVQILVDMGY